MGKFYANKSKAKLQQTTKQVLQTVMSVVLPEFHKSW